MSDQPERCSGLIGGVEQIRRDLEGRSEKDAPRERVRFFISRGNAARNKEPGKRSFLNQDDRDEVRTAAAVSDGERNQQERPSMPRGNTAKVAQGRSHQGQAARKKILLRNPVGH